ncbi:MAG: hypothetical protein GY895_19080 [Phycisphaera sp.]|nr:hypothetical protein [Phycisphaera sp.]
MDDTARRKIRCAECGYDLKETSAGGVCPECGLGVFESFEGEFKRRSRGRARAEAGVWSRVFSVLAAMILIGCAVHLAMSGRNDGIGRFGLYMVVMVIIDAVALVMILMKSISGREVHARMPAMVLLISVLAPIAAIVWLIST